MELLQIISEKFDVYTQMDWAKVVTCLTSTNPEDPEYLEEVAILAGIDISSKNKQEILKELKDIISDALYPKIEYTYLEKNGLTILGNVDSLKATAMNYMKNCDISELVGANKKNLTKSEWISEIERFLSICEDILINKSVDLFDYINLTKAGKFNQTKNILVARSKVQAIRNGDYYENRTFELRLEPCEPSDGTAVKLCISFYNTNDDVPIFDEKNIPSKPVVKRNTYIKELLPGHLYEDAKGTQFLYLGKYHNGRYEAFYSIKVSKKIQAMIDRGTSIEEVFHTSGGKQYYFSTFKVWYNKPKYVKDCGEAVDTTFTNRIFYIYPGESLTECLTDV